MSHLLAIDLGTSSVKVLLTTDDGQILSQGSAEYSIYHPQSNWAEQNPDVLWRAVARASKKVIQEANLNPAEIMGLCVSAQMLNILPVDGRGRPLTRMLSWLDTRSVAQADRIIETVGRDFFFDQTGNVPTAKDIIPKILWIKEELPEVWEKSYKLLDCKEYILYKITKQFMTDWHGASMYFLFDPRTRRWSEKTCQALGISFKTLQSYLDHDKVWSVGRSTNGNGSSRGS